MAAYVFREWSGALEDPLNKYNNARPHFSKPFAQSSLARYCSHKLDFSSLHLARLRLYRKFTSRFRPMAEYPSVPA
jgi:hypothetical protein